MQSIHLQAADEEGMEGAHMLCMADAPEAREEAVALWSWMRTQWALGLIEAWGTLSRSEVSAALCKAPAIQCLKPCMQDVDHGPYTASCGQTHCHVSACQASLTAYKMEPCCSTWAASSKDQKACRLSGEPMPCWRACPYSVKAGLCSQLASMNRQSS